MTDDMNGRDGSGSFDPAQAARSAVAAAAVGAAVGALRAFTARRSETEAPPADDERTIESDEELRDEHDDPDERRDEEPDAPEASAEPERAPEPEPEPRQQRQQEPQPEPAPPGQLFELSERARDAVRQLRGVEAEAVSGLARTPNGWTVTLEVVEVHRIPESTDVLASYEVELAEDGGLVRFERTRRYHRTQESDG